ncbi:MAG: DNA (cytosine-5-)-methyltransferase, partial [Dolichospermum sp.]
NGGHCLGFSEINQDAINTYCDNFGIEPSYNLGDITKIKELPPHLGDILGVKSQKNLDNQIVERDIFGNIITPKSMSLSHTNGFNDYFLFNDLRNGHTTIHSWDIIETTQRQKNICLLLLKNRRKSNYGELDGNPLSLAHFQNLDSSITQAEIDELVTLEILKSEEYRFMIIQFNIKDDMKSLTKDEEILLSFTNNGEIIIDNLKIQKVFKLEKISIQKTIDSLKQKHIIECVEIRYDVKNTKIQHLPML